jgi:murein DD-endopeptidase MepM/ murein hydrolase activator NlpD
VVFDPDFGRVVPPAVKLKVVGGWGIRRAGSPREHLHQGLDIPMPVGTPIFAAASGTVTQLATTDSSDAGIYVGIAHPSKLTSRYLHLSRALVEKGQRVEKGDPIGISGNTGLSEGPHLHFDLFAAAEILPTIRSTVGEPKGGFGRSRLGVAVPAEPWLPIDEYAPRVVASAEDHGIPLYHQRPREPSRRGIPLVAVAAGLGVATLLLITWGASSD